jgi:hypothetical protein
MKKIFVTILAVLMILSSLAVSACGGAKEDKVQIFERIVAENGIQKYVTEGTDGLVSQYERIEYSYKGSANKAYKTFYNTVMIYLTESQAKARFDALKATYGDDIKIMGRGVYINHEVIGDVDKNKDELQTYLGGLDFFLVPEPVEESK